MSINPVTGVIPASNVSFQGKHLPRTFASMMNDVYKKIPHDTFETENSVIVSTVLDDGRKIFATASFLHGKFHGLCMDEGQEILKSKFMSSALMRYNKSIASKKVQKKLGYEK